MIDFNVVELPLKLGDGKTVGVDSAKEIAERNALEIKSCDEIYAPTASKP